MLDFFGLLYFSQPTNGMVGDQVGAAANLAPIPSLNIIQFPFHIPVGVHSKGIGLPVFNFNLTWNFCFAPGFYFGAARMEVAT